MMDIGYGLITPYIAIVMLIALLSIVLAKMLGKATKNKELEAWSSVETGELVISVLIFLSIFGIYSVLLSVSEAWLVHPISNDQSMAVSLEPAIDMGGFLGRSSINLNQQRSPGSNIQLTLIETVTFKLKHTLYNRLMPMMVDLMKTKFALQLYAGLKGPKRGPGAISFQLPAAPGVNFFVKGCDTLIYIFTMISPTISAQVIGLEIIGALSYNVLLPLGILFRFIPFLRKFGNEMIAVSIAMCIFLPTAYLLFFKAVDDIETRHKVPGILRTEEMDEAKWSVMANTFYFGNTFVTTAPIVASMGTTFLFNAVDTATTFLFKGVTPFSTAFANVAKYKAWGPVNMALRIALSAQLTFAVFAVMIPAANLGGFVLVGLIIPMFAFMLSLSFVSALVKLLNIDISDSGVLL